MRQRLQTKSEAHTRMLEHQKALKFLHGSTKCSVTVTSLPILRLEFLDLKVKWALCAARSLP